MSVLYDLEWQLSNGTPVGSVNGVTTVDYLSLSGLSACTTYRWRIRTDDAGTKSDWSDWTSFQTELVVPVVAGVVDVLTLTLITGKSVLLSECGVSVACFAPDIRSGVSVAVPAIAVFTDFYTPFVATGCVVVSPLLDVYAGFLVPCYVGQMPDGVDRPRIVSNTPRFRVSHAS